MNFNKNLLNILLVFFAAILFAMMHDQLAEELHLTGAQQTAINFLVIGLIGAFAIMTAIRVNRPEPSQSEEDELIDELKKHLREGNKEETKRKLRDRLGSDE